MIAALYFWLGVVVFLAGCNLLKESWTDLGEFIGLAMIVAGVVAVTHALFGSP